MDIYEIFLYHPMVCAVKNEYQITILTGTHGTLKCRVGGNIYYSHSCGVMISEDDFHRISVPQAELDRYKEYTLVFTAIPDRKNYFTKPGESREITYSFKPVEKARGIRIYQLADSHGKSDSAVKCAGLFGEETDLLIFNGDIVSDMSEKGNSFEIFKIASEVAKGNIPCVAARGNHELRGRYAELYTKYIPSDNGRSFYTFRAGCIWGIVLDCGEDKADSYESYGGLACFHEFRRAETEFIKSVIKNKDYEYAASDVKYKIVISHNAFSYLMDYPFNIETEIYTEWCGLLKENVKPELMLCGHLHSLAISDYKGNFDSLGQPCRVIIGSELKVAENGERLTCMGAVLNDTEAEIIFNSEDGKIEKTIVEY